MNNIYFIIRHGESVLNEQERHQGWISHNPLTEKGKLQVEESAQKLKDEKIDMIYSSPLLRTKQTAKIISEKFGLPISFSSRLKDYRRSRGFEGLLTSEYSVRPDYLLWKQKTEFDKSFSLPDGESLENFQKRVTDFAKWLDKNITDKNVLIVAHDGVAHYLVRYWLGEEIETTSAENAQIYKIISETKIGVII